MLYALWLPIVLSAVIVFVASSIMHMVLPYHKSDYQKLPDEDKVMPVLRSAGLKRGLYVFPFTTHKDMKSPAMIEKYNQGPSPAIPSASAAYVSQTTTAPRAPDSRAAEVCTRHSNTSR